MNKSLVALVSCLVVLAGASYYLHDKFDQEPTQSVAQKTASAFHTTIIKKTVANGKIVPRKEVDIKPQVSGVVSSIHVEAGQRVNQGDLLATIEIIPDMEQLNSAESQLESSRINLRNARQELNRQQQLFDAGLTSENEYLRFVLQRDLQVQAVDSAENNVALIREGASTNADKVSNQVWATATGTVLDVPVKQGTFVIETNNFNDGTTIASIADMSDMIFEGSVDESEVGKIQEGMALILAVGALEARQFQATLEHIAPKGTEDEGTIRFGLRASIEQQDDVTLRAGYSASADIVLDRRDDVLAINEGLLKFDDNGVYVNVLVGEQELERRGLETGLSDGINIEVVSGLTEEEKIAR